MLFRIRKEVPLENNGVAVSNAMYGVHFTLDQLVKRCLVSHKQKQEDVYVVRFLIPAAPIPELRRAGFEVSEDICSPWDWSARSAGRGHSFEKLHREGIECRFTDPEMLQAGGRQCQIDGGLRLAFWVRENRCQSFREVRKPFLLLRAFFRT